MPLAKMKERRTTTVTNTAQVNQMDNSKSGTLDVNLIWQRTQILLIVLCHVKTKEKKMGIVTKNVQMSQLNKAKFTIWNVNLMLPMASTLHNCHAQKQD